MEATKTGRVALDKEAAAALSRMCKEIKEDDKPIKITPSLLASWITKRFHARDFGREKDRIREEFLNRRQWLKNALRDAKEEDIGDVLKEAAKALRTTRRVEGRR